MASDDKAQQGSIPPLEDVDKKEDVVYGEGGEEGDDDEPDRLKHIDAHNSVGLAVIEQQGVIPMTGKRIPTSKWEYWLYGVFYFANIGTGINQDAAAIRQALLNQAFPNGYLHWGGRYLSINSMLLDLTGILFAIQLVILLGIGPYADYGKWRPWLMIASMSSVYVAQFVLCGITQPRHWELAQGFFVLGQIGNNLMGSFYQATFSELVRNLPRMYQSEEKVLRGETSPEEHAQLDMLERSKLYNWVNIIGSAENVGFSCIALGIAEGVGYATDEKLNYSYKVLLGYFGAISVITTVPFFIVNKHRPGLKLPLGTKWYSAGPLALYRTAKNSWKLKQALLYLAAYFLLQESHGTYYNVLGLLRNEAVHYSPLLINAMSLVANLCGGLGTVACLYFQSKFKFTVWSGLMFGSIMTVLPNLWGVIGCYTTRIGFHNTWEFWLGEAWNGMMAAWGSYNVTMISEIAPAPKLYLFYALFNCVGKTSGFIGPFISSAVIGAADGKANADNYGFWVLFPLGVLGCVMLWFIDTDKAKIDSAKFLEEEARELYGNQHAGQVAVEPR